MTSLGYINKITEKLQSSEWGEGNPNSLNKINEYLKLCNGIFQSTPGYINVLKSMKGVLNGKITSLYWFNFFSQIRCAYFLHINGINITEFDKQHNRKKIDLLLNRNIYCEVKSFEPKMNFPTEVLTIDNYIINNFLGNKLIPALDEQDADLLIIDDVFSSESKNYSLLNYILSFSEEDNDRGEMIRSKIGIYLPKLLVLSFRKSFIENPEIKHIGDGWKEILKQLCRSVVSW